MKESSPEAVADIYETIRYQILENNPPETKQTYDRLIASGKSKIETINLIGSVVSVEMFHITAYKEPFNKARFVYSLNNLPIPDENNQTGNKRK